MKIIGTARDRCAIEICRFANGHEGCFCATGKAKVSSCDKAKEVLDRIIRIANDQPVCTAQSNET